MCENIVCVFLECIMLAMKKAISRFIPKDCCRSFSKNDHFSGHSLHSRCTDDVWQEASVRTTIRAENEVEAHKLANNYKVCKYERSWNIPVLTVRDVSGVEKKIQNKGANPCNNWRKLFIFVCQFGFRKWKSHVTERPIEDRSDVVKELYSELNYIKHHSGKKKKINEKKINPKN